MFSQRAGDEELQPEIISVSRTEMEELGRDLGDTPAEHLHSWH